MDIRFRISVERSQTLRDLIKLDGIIFHNPQERQVFVKRKIVALMTQSALEDVHEYCACSSYQDLRHCAVRSYIAKHGIADLSITVNLIKIVFGDSDLSHEHTRTLLSEVISASEHLFEIPEKIDDAQIESLARYVSGFSVILDHFPLSDRHKGIIERFSCDVARRSVELITRGYPRSNLMEYLSHIMLYKIDLTQDQRMALIN